MRGVISSSSLRLSLKASCSLSLPHPLPARLHRRTYPFASSRLLSNVPDPTKSFLVGPNEPPLLEHNMYSHWSNHILPKYHDRVALVAKSEPRHTMSAPLNSKDCLRLTYAQLDRCINSLALSLHLMDIKKGDTVGINTPNHSIYPILQWATAKIGAILVTINPSYAPSELDNVIKRTNCKVLFCAPSFKSKDTVPILSNMYLDNLQTLKTLVLINNESHIPGKRSRDTIWSQFLCRSRVYWYNDFALNGSGSEVEKLSHDVHSDLVVNLQFTSGTTGIPKAVSLTQRNLLNNAIHIGDRMNLTSSDVVCNVPPMFHCFGSVIGNLATLVKGATLVIPGETFDPRGVLKTVSEEKCTVLHGVGTMFLSEINALDQMKEKVDLSSLRTGVVAGSPVPEELMNQIQDQLGVKELTNLYGMTETSPATFQTQTSDHPSKRKTTVGSIYPHTMAKVVDLQTREVVKRGQKGELLVSGYSVQKGYWNDQGETDKALVKDEQGRIWMKSGDIAIIDSDGYLKIVGRAKDVIIRGGENLYPVAIEDCIIKVKGVGNVAVVGIEDDFYGEVVGVFIKRKSKSDQATENISAQDLVTEDEIRAAVKANMSGANVPKYIWFLDSIGHTDFPMTASGKIKKNELKFWVKDLIKTPS